MADRFVKTTVTGRVITWTFPNTTLEPVTLDTANVAQKVADRALIHGFIQTCSDPAAGKKTAAEKREAIAARASFLQTSEEWAKEREATGPKFDAGAVVTALAQVKFAGDIDKTNRAVEAVMAKRGLGRDDTLKMFAQDADVAAQIARNRAAAKPATFDIDEELAEIEAA